MRKITQEAGKAFREGKAYKKDNTEVYVEGENVKLSLHDNVIASRNIRTDVLIFGLCGWNTPTTRERLKGVGVYISIKKGQAYWRNGDTTHAINGFDSYITTYKAGE